MNKIQSNVVNVYDLYKKTRSLLRGTGFERKGEILLYCLFFLKCLSVINFKDRCIVQRLNISESDDCDALISEDFFELTKKSFLSESRGANGLNKIEKMVNEKFYGVDFEFPSVSGYGSRKYIEVARQIIGFIEQETAFWHDDENLAAKYFDDLVFIVFKGKASLRLPEELRELMVAILAPGEHDHVHDPFCQNGDLLTQAVRWAFSHHGRCNGVFFGQEQDPLACSIASQSLMLHKSLYSIEQGNALDNPKYTLDNKLQKYSVVLSVPPWGLNWKNCQAEKDVFGRYSRGVPAKNRAELAYVSHMVECMDDSYGRMAVVLPSGAVFRQGKDKEIRKSLVQDNLIDAVIGLPNNIFSGTTIELVLLVFRKQKESDSILFIDASQEFIESRGRSYLPFESVSKIVDVYKSRESVEQYSFDCPVEVVTGNDFNLRVDNYVRVSKMEPAINIGEIFLARKSTLQQLNFLGDEIEKCTKGLLGAKDN